ncbi:hypothetical protein ENSA7_49550 [Enhygromyxa salina]|uniref:Uncharacterized protein n=1 Tax=Enhygromyxa salina TaxID=215803 RepID=A0A2S9YIA8_9BACT|nr:hypothetical protein ENSA7_49550 [Enhygromyxa salina]
MGWEINNGGRLPCLTLHGECSFYRYVDMTIIEDPKS